MAGKAEEQARPVIPSVRELEIVAGLRGKQNKLFAEIACIFQMAADSI
jgi:hypothetical protein